MRRDAIKLWVGRFLLATIGPLVVLELVLQAGAFFMPGAPAEATTPAAADPSCVLCVGDSFTYGLGASNDARSYPARLEERLRAAPIDGRWRVANGGVPARNSRDVLLDLPRQFLRERPSFVVVLIGVNELWSRPQRADIHAAARDAGLGVSTWRPTWRTMKLVQLLTSRATKVGFFEGMDRRDAATPQAPAKAADATAATPPARPVHAKPKEDVDVRYSWELVGDWSCGRESIRFVRDGRGTRGTAGLRWSIARAGEIDVAEAGGDGGLRVRAVRKGPRLLLMPPGATAFVVFDRMPDPPLAAGERAPWDWYPEFAHLQEAGSLPAALALAERWIAAVPDDPSAWCNHLLAANRLQRRDVFAADLARLERILAATGTCDAAENLAGAYNAANDPARATALAREHVTRFPDSATLHFLVAQAADGVADYETAVREMTHAIENDAWTQGAELAWRFRERARWNGALGRDGDAIRDLIYAMRTQPDDKLDLQLLMRGRFAEGSLDEGFFLAEATGEEKAAVRRRFAELHEAWSATPPKTFVDHLTQIVRWVREQGAEPLLCVYPFHADALEAGQRQVAAREHVRLVDLSARFDALLATRTHEGLFVPDGHCNDAGYDLMAEEVAAALRELAR
jgi:lysophospholipase L1-like esterase